MVQRIVDQSSKDPEQGKIPILKLAVWGKKFHLYGASRLGILDQNDTLKRADLHCKLSLSDPQEEPELCVETIDYNRYGHDSIYTLKIGNKLYEGTNHMGNVLVTFSDKRLGYCEDDMVYRHRADIRTANDYAAFGAPLDDRQWYSTADSGVYRLNLNELESDPNTFSHEFGHMLGLSDRYNYFAKTDPSYGGLDNDLHSKVTVPMTTLQVSNDPNQTGSSLMSGGSTLTDYQIGIIFSRGLRKPRGEKRYTQVLLYTKSEDIPASGILTMDYVKGSILVNGLAVLEPFGFLTINGKTVSGGNEFGLRYYNNPVKKGVTKQETDEFLRESAY